MMWYLPRSRLPEHRNGLLFSAIYQSWADSFLFSSSTVYSALRLLPLTPDMKFRRFFSAVLHICYTSNITPFLILRLHILHIYDILQLPIRSNYKL
nr:MAG TPA: Phenol hydroxylase conserved region [Caudoviricetes sp.]